MRPVVSNLDPLLRFRLRALRRARERDAEAKVALLRRLGRRAVITDRYTETRVEQSWNEQIFRSVFGYETMFSHEHLPFHLLPKNVAGAGATRRYDDFSLGFFGIGDDRVLGCAELKGWGRSLTEPQSDRRDRATAVQQAFDTARAHPECRWVLVSDFATLLLYDIANSATPLATVKIDEIRDPIALADACAHLDRAALLGDGRKPGELTMADHNDVHDPAAPLPPRSDACRLVVRFTFPRRDPWPLHTAEALLRTAIGRAPCWHRVFDGVDHPIGYRLGVRHRDGWVGVETARGGVSVKLAVSLLGQSELSAYLPRSPTRFGNTDVVAISTDSMVLLLRFFTAFLRNFYEPTAGGPLSAELHDVEGVAMSAVPWTKNYRTPFGATRESSILTGEVGWAPAGKGNWLGASMVARLVQDLGAYFRDDDGGIVFDEDTSNATSRNRTTTNKRWAYESVRRLDSSSWARSR